MDEKLLREDIEYIVHCEEDGTVIGPISKKHAHLPGPRAELCHYSTYSMIFHFGSGKYGIQKKNPKKWDKNTAGKWDMGVAGHNCYVKDGDSWRILGFDENLAKEALEEIGVKLETCKSPEELISLAKEGKAVGYIFEKFNYKTDLNNEYVGLGFVIVPTLDVYFTDDEVVDFKWYTPKELEDYLKNNDDYCSPLPLVFEKAEKFRKEHLAKSS